MGMTRGTALVATVARVTELTGQQALANLEASAELDLDDLLVSASDAIYDQIDASGVDPTALSNETVYERAVAWHLLATLTILGYLQLPEGQSPPQNEQGQADPYAWSDPHLKRVRPRLSSGDQPARVNEALPVVGNFDEASAFGDEFWSDLPRRR